MLVKISAKSMRQEFHGCEPDYIANVCHGRCCRSSTEPSGIRVAIHRSEEEAIRARGAEIEGGRIVANAEKRCPFQTEADLCGLHFTPDKPFGCIASPFILTAADTLVVRNRYRLLKCYRDGELPAYRAFAASLLLLFGEDEAQRIASHLERGGGDLHAEMLDGSYRMLTELLGRPPLPRWAGT